MFKISYSIGFFGFMTFEWKTGWFRISFGWSGW
jgi:hypothetical protein